MAVRPPFNGNQRQFSIDLAGKDVMPVTIGRSLIYSNDFQKLIVLGRNIFKYDHPPFLIFNKDKEIDSVCMTDKASFLSFMITEGKKGPQTIRPKSDRRQKTRGALRTSANASGTRRDGCLFRMAGSAARSSISKRSPPSNGAGDWVCRPKEIVSRFRSIHHPFLNRSV